MMMYVDDIMVMAETEEAAERAGRRVVEILTTHGVNINWGKSHLKPVQVVTFLGYVINLKERTISISIQKRKEIKKPSSTRAEEYVHDQEASSKVGREAARSKAGTTVDQRHDVSDLSSALSRARDIMDTLCRALGASKASDEVLGNT